MIPRERLSLSHRLSPTFPTRPFAPASRTSALSYVDDGAYAQSWTLSEHTATHVDAPAHVVPGGRTVDELTPAELLVGAVVVDFRDRAAEASPLTVVDLESFERRHGPIPRRSAVLLLTGWDKRLETNADYFAASADGRWHVPTFGSDAARWLIDKRDVACVGVDGPSLDGPSEEGLPVHRAILGADRFGIENLTRLDWLPPLGATFCAAPLPLERGSGSPCQAFAWW